MRWMLLVLFVAGIAVGCEKEIHEARAPLDKPLFASK